MRDILEHTAPVVWRVVLCIAFVTVLMMLYQLILTLGFRTVHLHLDSSPFIMQVIDTEIEGVKIIIPDVHGDARGWFVEQYNAERYKAAGITADFVQDNESFSSKGVVRGLHWQAAPYTQAKLVRVIRGAVWDVVVDIRKCSPTFGKHVSVVLSAENHKQFFIPRGFAHGFIVLEDNTLFSYKCDNFYHPESDRGLKFDDLSLGIKWPKLDVEINLSEKDSHHPTLAHIEPFVD